MQVILSERVKILLHTLNRDDREKVQTWFSYLRNWEEDEFIKSQSVTLDVHGQPVCMFRTSTDIRICYTVDLLSKTTTVIDMASLDTILSFGTVAAGGS
jgi:hypothetical protein